MENMRKNKDIKLVKTERRKNYLVSEPSYHTYYKVFHRNLNGNKNEKNSKIHMNKPVCLGLSVIDLSKTVMYEFWYDYVKPKYGEKAKLLLYGYLYRWYL